MHFYIFNRKTSTPKYIVLLKCAFGCPCRKTKPCENKQQQKRTAPEQLQHILVGGQLHSHRRVQTVLQESSTSRRVTIRHAYSIPMAEEATHPKRACNDFNNNNNNNMRFKIEIVHE